MEKVQVSLTSITTLFTKLPTSSCLSLVLQSHINLSQPLKFLRERSTQSLPRTLLAHLPLHRLPTRSHAARKSIVTSGFMRESVRSLNWGASTSMRCPWTRRRSSLSVLTMAFRPGTSGPMLSKSAPSRRVALLNHVLPVLGVVLMVCLATALAYLSVVESLQALVGSLQTRSVIAMLTLINQLLLLPLASQTSAPSVLLRL